MDEFTSSFDHLASIIGYAQKVNCKETRISFERLVEILGNQLTNIRRKYNSTVELNKKLLKEKYVL